VLFAFKEGEEGLADLLCTQHTVGLRHVFPGSNPL
jgi:hypothetical protein